MIYNTDTGAEYTTNSHFEENPNFHANGTLNFDALKYVSLNRDSNVYLEEGAVPDLIKVIEMIALSAGQGDPFEGDKYDWIKKAF